MAPALDLANQRFGRLTAHERVGTDKHRYALWRCTCDCGKEIVSRGRHLRRGEVRSCGCLQRESQVRNGKMTRHGHWVDGKPSLTYASWTAMKGRCLRKNDPFFFRYGGRGITICEQWMTFERFLGDMGERPPGRSLDRIDNDGNYEPGNCRWATAQEQAQNRSKPYTHRFRFDQLPDWVDAKWCLAAAAYLERTV